MPLEPKTQALEKTPQGELTVQRITAEPKWRRYFSGLAEHYSTMLHNAFSDAALIRQYEDVIYLVDADVVGNLAELTFPNNQAKRETLQLFQNPNFKFGIPLGAFEEIKEWLRVLTPNRSAWADDVSTSKPIDRTQAIRELADIFDLHYSYQDQDLIPLMDRVSLTVKSTRDIADRLTFLFELPNFVGIPGDYDLIDVSELRSLLAKLDRNHSDSQESRLTKDYRDAVNLAIVASRTKSFQWDGADVKTPAYILLTQTDVILYLVERAGGYNPESSSELGIIFGTPGPMLPTLFPVLSPSRAFIVEEARRIRGLTDNTFRELREEQRIYEDLGSALRERGSVDAEIFQGKLLQLSTIYTGDRSLYRELEKSRAIQASLEYFEQRKIVDNPNEKRLKRLEEETESLFRVLARLHRIMADKVHIEYQAKSTRDSSGLFDTVEIFSSFPTELVLYGEIYRSELPDELPRAYSLRWQTSCTERAFFSALSAILRPPPKGKGHVKTICLDPVNYVTSHFEGIQVFTTLGVFASTLDKLPKNWGIRHITLESLVEAVAEVTNRPVREFAIEAVRIITAFAHFQLDLAADDL